MARRYGEKKEGDQYDALNWPGGNKFDSQARELFLPFRCFGVSFTSLISLLMFDADKMQRGCSIEVY